jgi:hypothetical protein
MGRLKGSLCRLKAAVGEVEEHAWLANTRVTYECNNVTKQKANTEYKLLSSRALADDNAFEQIRVY